MSKNILKERGFTLNNIELIKNKLREMLDEERYIHSIGVMDCSLKLADFYKYSPEKAFLAGLLHDCAKCLPEHELLKNAINSGIVIDNVMLNQKELLHGPAGKYIANKFFDINDEEILNAIAFHTTGRPEMGILEKIIYLADIIEPNRNFEGVDYLRKCAFENLDLAVIKAMDSTLRYVLDLNGLIHPLTILARNHLIISLNNEWERKK